MSTEKKSSEVPSEVNILQLYFMHNIEYYLTETSKGS